MYHENKCSKLVSWKQIFETCVMKTNIRDVYHGNRDQWGLYHENKCPKLVSWKQIFKTCVMKTNIRNLCHENKYSKLVLWKQMYKACIFYRQAFLDLWRFLYGVLFLVYVLVCLLISRSWNYTIDCCTKKIPYHTWVNVQWKLKSIDFCFNLNQTCQG